MNKPRTQDSRSLESSRRGPTRKWKRRAQEFLGSLTLHTGPGVRGTEEACWGGDCSEKNWSRQRGRYSCTGELQKLAVAGTVRLLGRQGRGGGPKGDDTRITPCRGVWASPVHWEALETRSDHTQSLEMAGGGTVRTRDGSPFWRPVRPRRVGTPG